MKISIRSLVVWSTLSMLRAQDASPPPLPDGPLIRRVDTPAQWVVTTQVAQPAGDPASGAVGSSPAASPAKPAKPSVTIVTKNESIILEKVITPADATFDVWLSSGWAVTKANGTSGWIILPSGGNTFNRTDYSRADFAGFDWISLKNFSGRRDVMGKHCLVFKDKVITMDPQEVGQLKSAAARFSKGPPTPFDAEGLKTDVEADIDDKTRLPVMLIYGTSRGVMARSYVFQSTEGPLSLPPDVRALIIKYQQMQRRMSVPIAPS